MSGENDTRFVPSAASRPRNTYGDPDSSLFSHRAFREELEVYRRLLNAAIPGYVFGKARERIMEAADELAWARARERYAAIKELPDWRLDDVIPQRLRGGDKQI